MIDAWIRMFVARNDVQGSAHNDMQSLWSLRCVRYRGRVSGGMTSQRITSIYDIKQLALICAQ